MSCARWTKLLCHNFIYHIDIVICFLQDFAKVLNFELTNMLVLYGAVAVCGYYYFGRAAHTLVTEDLASDSPVKGISLIFPGFTIFKLVSALILLNVFKTYPNLLLVKQASLDFASSIFFPHISPTFTLLCSM